MAITTLDGVIAATRQKLTLNKTATRTTIANGWFSLFDVAGNPGAGTLAGSSTAAGVVPTDATAGYPRIDAFSGSNIGYLGAVNFGNTVACRLAIFDRLFLAGAYAFNANTALASQPSYSGRLPGTDYRGLQIWAETVTAATGNQTWNVTYTNESGTGSRTTGAVGIGAAPTVGRCWQLPLQAGDLGVQKIDNVQGGTGTAGTANIMVLRPLWQGRVLATNYADVHDFAKTMMPQIYEDSALYVMVNADSTSSGLPEMLVDLIQG